MRQLERVLVATDLGEVTDSILQTGLMLCRSFGSRLYLVHVIPETLPEPWVQSVGRDQVMEQLETLGEDLRGQGATIEETAVLSGAPAYHICEHAEAKDVNLIVMACNKAPRSDIRLGVNAERALRNSAKPIWLVKPGPAQAPREILCPIDRSGASRRALDNAIRLAREFRSRLTVMTVNEVMPAVYARMVRRDYRPPEGYLRDLRQQFSKFLAEFDFTGVGWRELVREGNPHVEILSVVAELKCDLIVMGREGRTGPSRMLVGSVAQKVTRVMPCAIVTVNDEDLLVARLDASLRAVAARMREAAAAMRDGYPTEALGEFEQCLLEIPTHVPAWEGMAEAYEKLGDRNKADRCREAARRIRGEFGNMSREDPSGSHAS